MNRESFVRDAALLLFAGAVGWWAHGTGTPVHAAGGVGFSNAEFQLGGGPGLEGALTLYNADSKTLFVYPAAAAGNSHLNCAYSIHFERPGGPLERQNCAMGSAFR